MLVSLAQAGDLLLWYNAVFVIIFGVGFFFTLLQLIGLGGEAVHADADVDAGVDTDVDADADLDADVDADVDVDHDIHADHASVGIGSAAAQLFGLGKVPLSISLMVLCYTVGVAGWTANRLIATHLGEPGRYFVLSMLAALVIGFVVLRFVGGFMHRYVPAFSTSAVDSRQLVGATAETVLPVNDRVGLAALHDKHGTLHTVQCRTAEGADAIAKGEKVVLVRWLPDRKQYVVGRAQ